MRNLKKILALALVFAMAFTFTAGAAVDFTDKAEIGASYLDDVNMLVELGVIAGYPDGSFGPAKNITRAEFAKMAYTIKYGSDTDGNLFAAQKSTFTDVEGNANVAWAKGYINYCANQKIVSGVGNNKYNPQGNITVAEAAKMLLVILGCDSAKEGFTGANWMANVVAKAIDLGLFNGWAGDPSQLATRELVAKLMRNAILSPVYTYSAITGMGSQMNALGSDYNETLGQKTMGLQTVTGIVVANERYGITTDDEGNALWYDTGRVDENGDPIMAGSYISEDGTGEDSEESIIWYEAKNSNGDVYSDTIKIDRALSDDLLGNKVNVFFRADRTESSSSGRIDYKNIEVIGDVLVHSDTVVYDVPAIAVDIMPNGDSSSEVEVRPYITFTVDGEVKTIKASSKVAKAPKNKDVQLQDPYKTDVMNDFINKYAYIMRADIDDDTAMDKVLDNEDEFIAGMGIDPTADYTATLGTYRFISLDGGVTYPYMIKTTTADANIDYGTVTSYNEARGTIKVTGESAFDLEDVVLNDEIAVDDVVVFYRANGKIVIDKVEVVTGAVEAFGDDGSVVIGGNTYWAWNGNEELNANEDLFEYYDRMPSALGASTTYYVYNNMIMDIDANAEAAAVENYAVILRSWLDQSAGVAYVKLGFADNTEGTYKVGKLHLENRSEPNDASNDKIQDFKDNAMFGYVVQYKIQDDGAVDLSQQYFQDVNGANSTLKTYAYGETIDPSDLPKIVSNKAFNGKYALNDASVVFAIYGTPKMSDANTLGWDEAGFADVKAKAFKLNEVTDIYGDIIPEHYSANMSTNDILGSYVVNTTSTNNNYIVAAAVTVGDKLEGAVYYKETRDYAYIVAAKQVYNLATDESYAELTVINKDGLKELKTIDAITDFNSIEYFSENKTQKLDAWVGGFVKYDVNAEGVITMLDVTAKASVAATVPTFVAEDKSNDGFYLVTVTAERGDILTYIPGNTATNTKVSEAAVKSASYHEDGYSIVAIGEDEYDGDALAKASKNDTVTENKGNAVIYIYEGQVKTVFSFADGYNLV